MKTNPFLPTAVLAVTVLCVSSLRAQFSPAELQGAVDASFGAWDPVNVNFRGAVYSKIWSNQSSFTLDGVDAARLVTLHDPYISYFQLRSNVTGPTKLYFSYFCGLSNSFGGAGAQIRVDSTVAELPASPYWQEGSIDIPAGSHPVSWGFNALSVATWEPYKSAYLDQVWTENDPRPRITSSAFVEAPQGLAVLHQIATNKPCHAYAAAGLPSGLSLDGGSGLITGTPMELGSFNAKVTATNGAGSHTQSVLFRVLKPSGEAATGLDSALDGRDIQWSQQADVNSQPWSGSLTGFAKDGIDAATVPLRVPPDAADTSNWLGAEIQGPGRFQFRGRTVSFANAGVELPGEFLFLNARFNRKHNISVLPWSSGGFVNGEWQQKTVSIPNGRHFLEFAIERVISTGWPASDTLVCLDQASFIPQTESFTFRQWMKVANSYPSDGDYSQELLSKDEDGDRVTLLAEYALGGSPAYNDAALLPEVAIVDGHLTMTVHKAPGTSGIEFTVQANKSLAGNGWTTFGTEIMNEDQNVLIVRCTKTIRQEPAYMLRLRVLLDNADG